MECLVTREDCHLNDGNVWTTLLCELPHLNVINKMTCAKMTNLIHGIYVWGNELSLNVVNLLYDLMIHKLSGDMRLVT
jgi:hypothetical protein